MSTPFHLTHLGMPGSGPTRKAAKRDAERKIERLLKELRGGPQLVAVGGYAALVWPDAHGWGYRIVLEPQGLRMRSSHSLGFSTEEEATWSAYHHLAQNSWSIEAVPDDQLWLEAITANMPPGERKRELRGQLMSWTRWQRTYRAARDAGIGDPAARDIASGLRPMPTPTPDVGEQPTLAARPHISAR